jgi:hypothetical protein
VAALAQLSGLDTAGVAEALDQLGAFGLLDGVALRVEPQPEPGRLSRRSVIQRGLAVGAGVGAVSMITAVAIPASAAAKSSTQTAKNPKNYVTACSTATNCSPGSVCAESSEGNKRCKRPHGATCFYYAPKSTSYLKTSVCSNGFCKSSGHCPV